MIPATVAAPLYFRPVGVGLYEVVRFGQAAGRVRWTGTGFDAYTVTGTRVAEDVPVMVDAADAIVVAVTEEFLATRPTAKARELAAAALRTAGHDELAATVDAVTPTTAVAVSRALRAAGVQTIAPETRFRRPGVAVMRSVLGTVTIEVGLELLARSRRRSDEVVEVLTERGYAVEPRSETAETGTVFLTVRGRRV